MAKKRIGVTKRRYRWGIEFTSETPVKIPINAKKGVVFDLMYRKETVGQLKFTGAGIHVRRAGKGRRWRSFYSFEKFLSNLVGD
jgi:hypothetical protein